MYGNKGVCKTNSIGILHAGREGLQSGVKNNEDFVYFVVNLWKQAYRVAVGILGLLEDKV